MSMCVGEGVKKGKKGLNVTTVINQSLAVFNIAELLMVWFAFFTW